MSKRNMFMAGLVLSALVPGAVVNSYAANIIIDPTHEGSSIDGFGVFGARDVWWSNGPFFDDKYLSIMIDTLGVTLWRTETYPLPAQSEMWTKQIPFLKAIMAKAQQSKEPLKVFASIWTPPGYMKDNNSEIGGGALLPDQRDAFGQYVADYVTKWKNDVGYDLFAISPQNEPAIGTGYNSCPYWPGDFAAMFSAVAKKFKENKTKCWLHYTDNITWTHMDWQGQVVEQVCKDPVADSIGEIMSMHYAGTVEQNRDYYGSMQQMAAGKFRRTVNMGRQTRLWNSEFGGQFDTWDENLPNGGENAWNLATNFFMCLQYDFNAVVYWQGSQTTDPDPLNRCYALIEIVAGQPVLGPRFHVAKQFYRYLRPGAVKIGCTSSDTNNVWALAYHHKDQQTTTILLMNRSNTQQSVTLSGTGLPSTMSIYQTSPNQNCVKVGTVGPGGTVTLPVRSMTTIYNSPTATAIQPRVIGVRPNAAMPISSGSNTELVDLRGATIRVSSLSAARPSGIYLKISLTKSGAAIYQQVLVGSGKGK